MTHVLDVLLTTGERISFQLTMEANAHTAIGIVQAFLDGKVASLGSMALNRSVVVSMTIVESHPADGSPS